MLIKAISLVMLAFLSSAFAGGVYWTDRGASQLKRMNFDGSNLQVITLSGAVVTPGSNIRGIAVDTVSNRVFWADNNTDRLLRANLDGTASTILYTISGGNSFPADIRLDLANRFLYWCDRDRSRIQRSSLDGGSVVNIVTNTTGIGPYFMDLDLNAGKIYFGDAEAGSIFRMNLDGTNKETLLTGNNKTRGVKVDPGAGMLYWINRDDKKIHRCPLSAFTNGTIVLTHPAVQTLYTNLDTPHGLAIDISAKKLYWADTGSNSGVGNGDKAVSRGDCDGSTPMEILATGNEPWDVDLDFRCNSYAEWRMRFFRKDAPASVTDPDADPDGDGILNAAEYALGLPPLEKSTSGLPQSLSMPEPTNNAVYHAIKFIRRPDAGDLKYWLQVSTNLTSWDGSLENVKTIEIQTAPIADGLEEVTARTVYPVSGMPIHFMRLQMSR